MSSEVDFTEKQLDLLAWLEKNRNKLLGGLGAAIVIGVAVAAAQNSARKAEIAAANDLAALGAQLDDEGERMEPKAAEYLAVRDEHPGSGAAERALILAAGALFAEGDFDGATTRFNEYLASYPEGIHIPTARLGKAACADAKGEAEQALAEYKTVAESFPNDPVAEQAKLARAHLLESTGKPDEALRIYDQMIASVTGGAFTSDAHQKRAKLLELHPELEPKETNAPPAFAPALQQQIQNLQQAIPQATTTPAPTAPKTEEGAKSEAPAPDAAKPPAE
jgi:TolA-binding protein